MYMDIHMNINTKGRDENSLILDGGVEDEHCSILTFQGISKH